MYTIKSASELTGAAVATLRAWERRYDVVTPHRTESGYRLYDDGALRTIVAVGGRHQDQAPRACRRLGHGIGPAARHLARLLEDLDTAPAEAAVTSPS